MKLTDNELKVMEIIWDSDYTDDNGEITAKVLAEILTEDYGWIKNLSYLYFRRLLEKGAIERRYPNYLIRPLITKQELSKVEVNEKALKRYEGGIYDIFKKYMKENEVGQVELYEFKKFIDTLLTGEQHVRPEFILQEDGTLKRRGPGRPKGSKNKKKIKHIVKDKD